MNLRQKINTEKPNEVCLYLFDSKCFPNLTKREHILRYDNDLSKSEYIEANKNQRGFAESKEVCDWLS